MNAPKPVRGKLNLFAEKYLLVSDRAGSIRGTEQGHREMRFDARPCRRRRWQTFCMLALAYNSVITLQAGIQFKKKV